MGFKENIFHFDFSFIFKIHSSTKNCLYIWGIYFKNLSKTNKKVCKLLICGAFIKTKPGSSTFVIDAKEKSAVWSKIFCHCNKVFIFKMRINCNCKNNILATLTDFLHIAERFTISVTVQTVFKSAHVRKIIFIRKIPGTTVLVFWKSFTSTNRPTCIFWIICVHQTDSTVNFLHFSQKIVLIYIKTTFTTVAHIQSTLSLSKLYFLDFHKNTFLFESLSEN